MDKRKILKIAAVTLLIIAAVVIYNKSQRPSSSPGHQDAKGPVEAVVDSIKGAVSGSQSLSGDAQTAADRLNQLLKPCQPLTGAKYNRCAKDAVNTYNAEQKAQ